MSPAFTSENPLHRRAALAALAITSEGCAGKIFKFSYREIEIAKKLLYFSTRKLQRLLQKSVSISRVI